ncbi:hypothetical protein EC973_002456 [Apophysomyces ossiformis]|uniref:UBA domain-containing protein n=1 Tax=Apophysomyces ossiformis TaxID=679940 RepID=A0A8H7BNQ5_9FUNG|nr:hypothetical protein EC973_002456 [Apophysomyces ossiformis]
MSRSSKPAPPKVPSKPSYLSGKKITATNAQNSSPDTSSNTAKEHEQDYCPNNGNASFPHHAPKFTNFPSSTQTQSPRMNTPPSDRFPDLPDLTPPLAGQPKATVPDTSNEPKREKYKDIPSNIPQDRVLAQLIDMGFGIEEAKAALIASNQQDVQAAIDILIENNIASQQSRKSVHARKAMFDSAEETPNERRDIKSDKRSTNGNQFANTRHEAPNGSIASPQVASRQQTFRGREGAHKQAMPSVQVDEDISSDEDPEIEKQRMQELKRLQEIRRKEYIEQIKAQRKPPKTQTSDTPSSYKEGLNMHSQTGVSAKQPQPQPHISQIVEEQHQRGNELFKLGQFAGAKIAYSQAMAHLPPGHDQLIVLCNNRAAARLQLQEYQKCIYDCDFVIKMVRFRDYANIECEGPVVRWRTQLLKAIQRKAEALEKLGNYNTAIASYEEIIKLSNRRNDQVYDAIKRCQEALSFSFTARPTDFNTSKVRTEHTTPSSAFPDIDYSMFDVNKEPLKPEKTGKAVKEMRAKAAQKEAEEAEKLAKADWVNSRLTQWKTGKEKNLRILLATLDTVLWSDAKWPGVQLNEIVEPKRCKIMYMKAIAKVHPDKASKQP